MLYLAYQAHNDLIEPAKTMARQSLEMLGAWGVQSNVPVVRNLSAAYELIEARDKAGDTNVSVLRIEQLYPFPGEALLERMKRMTSLEQVVWAQEEPRNQGYWAHVAPRIERRLGEAGLEPKRPVYAGRAVAASPATGLAKRHAAEQAALIAEALGHGPAEPAQRKAS